MSSVSPGRSPPCACEVIEEQVRLHAGRGPADGQFVYPAADRPRWASLIAGPHPYMAGERRNNIVAALLAGFARSGAAALTFDYRRPGTQSAKQWAQAVSTFWQTSVSPDEPAWLDDARNALRAVGNLCGADLPLVLAGYSFGCWVATQLAAEAKVCAVILVSPNPGRHEWAGLRDRTFPLLVIHSDNDFACSAPVMEEWFSSLNEPKERCLLPAGEHFFRGLEQQVLDVALGFLARHGLAGVAD